MMSDEHNAAKTALHECPLSGRQYGNMKYRSQKESFANYPNCCMISWILPPFFSDMHLSNVIFMRAFRFALPPP
jgi:hypothetical protein